MINIEIPRGSEINIEAENHRVEVTTKHPHVVGELLKVLFSDDNVSVSWSK